MGYKTRSAYAPAMRQLCAMATSHLLIGLDVLLDLRDLPIVQQVKRNVLQQVNGNNNIMRVGMPCFATSQTE